MLISVKDIPIIGKEYEFDVKNIEIEAKIIKPVHFKGKIYKSGEDIRVDGNIATKLQVECHRCLDSFSIEIEADMDLYYRPYPSVQDEEEEIPIEELGLLHYKDNTVDLGQAIRDTIIIEMPLKLVCDDDCLGLCDQCGANKNIEACDCKKEDTSYNPFKDFFEKQKK